MYGKVRLQKSRFQAYGARACAQIPEHAKAWQAQTGKDYRTDIAVGQAVVFKAKMLVCKAQRQRKRARPMGQQYQNAGWAHLAVTGFPQGTGDDALVSGVNIFGYNTGS